MWGDVLGGLGEVFGRKKPRKNLGKTYKITLLIPTPIFAVLIFNFSTVIFSSLFRVLTYRFFINCCCDALNKNVLHNGCGSLCAFPCARGLCASLCAPPCAPLCAQRGVIVRGVVRDIFS